MSAKSRLSGQETFRDVVGIPGQAHNDSYFVAGGGPMGRPLRDESYFARVFVETGAPTWPNCLDLDPINLYMEMRKAGRLQRVAAA